MVLFEYRIDPQLTQKDPLTFFKGSINISISSTPSRMEKVPLQFSCPVRDEASSDPPPAVIVNALGKLSLYRLQEKARAEVEAGQLELAAGHLKNLATTLVSRGEKQLAQTVLLEVENLHDMQGMSEDGQKAIKYGTRSLLLKNDRV